MTARDPDGRIPEARLEPRSLAERMVRAGTNAKRQLRRAAWLVRQVVVIALGVGVLLAAVTFSRPRQRAPEDDSLEQYKAEFRESIQELRRYYEQRNREYAQERECRPPEYRPDAWDAPPVTP